MLFILYHKYKFDSELRLFEKLHQYNILRISKLIVQTLDGYFLSVLRNLIRFMWFLFHTCRSNIKLTKVNLQGKKANTLLSSANILYAH